MGATPVYGLPYPGLGDSPNGPAQIQALADEVEAELVRVDADAADLDTRQAASFLPDVGFPASASVTSSPLPVLRYTIAAAAFARRFALVATVFMANSQSTDMGLEWYAGATAIGRAQTRAAAAIGVNMAVCSTYDLPADTAVVLEVRMVRVSGTGVVTNSIGTYCQGSVVATAV